MLVLIQRVNYSRLHIEGRLHAEIGRGVLALVGIEKDDDEKTVNRLTDKLLAYRLFPDAGGKMNLSLQDVEGDLMLVSQFTLAADTDSGLRPSFSSAKSPQQAQELYELMVSLARERHVNVASGIFAADMQIGLENDGPVSFILRA